MNVNSIISNEKRNILLDFTKVHDPDIMLLSETKLNSRHKMEFEKYNMYRSDRPKSKQGGGCAILVRRTIPHTHLLSQNNKCTTLETCIINIKLPQDKNLFIISIYATNSDHTNKIKSEMDIIFSNLKLQSTNNYYLIAGDWNARSPTWGDQEHNQRGKIIEKWLENNMTKYKTKIIKPKLPTYPRKNSYLDFAMMDGRLSLHDGNDTSQTIDYESDHRANIYNSTKRF